MPAKSPISGTPPAAADDQTVGFHDPERTPGSPNSDHPPAGEHAAAEREMSDSSPVPSAAERLGAERTERRHQRMLARESSTATREPDNAERRERATGSLSGLTTPWRHALRDQLSVAAIALLTASAALGAILGALSVAGWVIGLLVAGLTAILSAVLRPRSRTT
jgi:hypothetical protein